MLQLALSMKILNISLFSAVVLTDVMLSVYKTALNYLASHLANSWFCCGQSIQKPRALHNLTSLYKI